MAVWNSHVGIIIFLYVTGFHARFIFMRLLSFILHLFFVLLNIVNHICSDRDIHFQAVIIPNSIPWQCFCLVEQSKTFKILNIVFVSPELRNGF